ncbi:FecR family protein [Pedobacter sp. MC2016-14]|uniref:FecR family protein n=1 Tax=Pedobacter sp. MC2016-14 TaxID=2897327 RepID=UPI001E4852A2|nr:FecR family protein [Pedobacter sp. MC2016-14]MCD0490576.1 FecR family protein [Pedobacter sp. MC2016-14]
MSENSEYIAHLTYKFNNGTISPGEMQSLMDWYNGHDDLQAVIPTKEIETHEAVKSRILTGLMLKIAEPQPARTKLFRWNLRMAAAIAAVVMIAVAAWLTLQNKGTVKHSEFTQTGIEPGTNKATLTLADGRTINLSNTQTGIVAGEKITYANGVPIENIDPAEMGDANTLVTLHTPRGGTYSITLPDGTDVWLNAESTIKYPSKFAEDARIVQLTGEAYFHVKSSFDKKGKKIPFRVAGSRQQVEVLGTQFNMNAYPQQADSKTTLVEGKVLVTDQTKKYILAPNEQALTSKNSTKVLQVTAGNYTAWRDGKFSFDGKTFEETMNDIGRWYDLDVVYEGRIPEEELTGDAYRNQKINLVLRLLDVAGIDYKLDISRRKLIIKGEKKQNTNP